MSRAVDEVLERLARTLPDARPVPLHEPNFEPDDWRPVKDCLDSGWVSSVGAYVDQFEAALSELTGVAHAVATVNGTAALHAAQAARTARKVPDPVRVRLDPVAIE